MACLTVDLAILSSCEQGKKVEKTQTGTISVNDKYDLRQIRPAELFSHLCYTHKNSDLVQMK